MLTDRRTCEILVFSNAPGIGYLSRVSREARSRSAYSRLSLIHILVGLAMAHIEPAGLPPVFGGLRGGGGGSQLLTESTTVAVVVIVAWVVVWTGLGAWRMATRDA